MESVECHGSLVVGHPCDVLPFMIFIILNIDPA
jgi:hypothetical protein